MPPDDAYFNDQFARTREEFAGDAVSALRGIRSVLDSLSTGIELCGHVDKLIEETLRAYTRP